MWKTLLLAGVIAATTPTVADACGNAVERVTDYVGVLVKAEKYIEEGRIMDASRKIYGVRFPANLRNRANDVKAIIKLRTSKDKEDLESVVAQFQERAEKGKDVRYRAWVAEAMIGLGKKDEARAMLVSLKESDLMPDAYAFAALAKLSSGTERFELWKQCRTRAKNKGICELPNEVKS